MNRRLQNGDQEDLMRALTNPSLGLAYCVDDFAAPLYYEEMKIDRIESEVRNLIEFFDSYLIL